jgi:hypothetical protein
MQVLIRNIIQTVCHLRYQREMTTNIGNNQDDNPDDKPYDIPHDKPNYNLDDKLDLFRKCIP